MKFPHRESIGLEMRKFAIFFPTNLILREINELLLLENVKNFDSKCMQMMKAKNLKRE